jgi:hypothetical protein
MSKEKEKSYPMPLSKRFEVTFKRSFGKFKKGDVTAVTLPIAAKWIASDLVDSTTEIKAELEKIGGKELIEPKKKGK